MKRTAKNIGGPSEFNDTDFNALKKPTFTRGFEHVNGNWPSHVYLSGSYNIRRISKLCTAHYTSTTHSTYSLVPIESPHVSLSRPFVLRSHQIQPFVKYLGGLINAVHTFSAEITSSYQVLLNDNKTRLFLALLIEDCNDNLLSLLRRVDEILLLYRQPTYYTNPIFHISFASHPVDPSDVHTTDDTITVDNRFFEAHKLELSDIIDGDESNDESDQWNKAAVVQSAALAIQNAPESKRLLGGLLDGYDSDSDGDVPTISDQSKASDSPPAMSKVITFDAVECKIGNRVFRFDLAKIGATLSYTNTFYEVFAKADIGTSK